MVNCIDNEKLLKNIIKQFCDQNFKFTLNLKILGSIHVQVDNNEVLTCFLDEKFFKSSQTRSLITTNQNLFNSLNVVKPLSESNAALNLVTTLNQLQQHPHQQLKLVNPSQLLPSVNTQSLSSSSSTCSKSSTSSSSSYFSGDSKQHKRKRSNAQNSDDGGSSSTSTSSRKEHQNTDDDEEDEDDANSSDHNLNENNEHVDNENEDKLNSSSNAQTPVKRSKKDENDGHDEAAAAAANALSLISAAAVASKLYNQQNIQNFQQTPSQHNFHSIAANLNQYQNAPIYNSNNENEQPGPSAAAGSSCVVPNNFQNSSQKPLKPKSRFIMNDYEQQLKQQIFQQSIENTSQAQSSADQNHHNLHHHHQQQQQQPTPAKPVVQQMNAEMARGDPIKTESHDQDSSLEESQLYMDEDNLMNKNDKENEEQRSQQLNNYHETHPTIQIQPHQPQQQQQHLMMAAAAAAALMNNKGINSPVGCITDNPGLKLFMPHSLAINLNAVKQQQLQQQQAGQILQIQNGEKLNKKKMKNLNIAPNSLSPSTANLVPANGPNSNKSTDSSTSCSSSTSSTCSSTTNNKQNKKSRQTIAALAAAAAAASASAATATTSHPGLANTPNPLTPSNQNVDVHKNLVGLASQYGLKDTSNIEQTINEVSEKSKNAIATPKANSMKHVKKQHLLNSASAQVNPPSKINTPAPKKEKTKKSKINEPSNLVPNQNPNLNVLTNGVQSVCQSLIPNGVINGGNPSPNSINFSSLAASNAQAGSNPVQAAAVAAAAALHYHQFLNNNLGKNVNNTSQNGLSGKFNMPTNGLHPEEMENHQKHYPIKYEDANEEEPCDEADLREAHQNGHINGPLSIKSLTGPLTQSNTNSQNTPGPNGSNGSNLEFECTACEKKFKYYCYYKRHMDACHSDIPKYVCDTCNKSYKWEASFRQHLRSHHTNEHGSNGNNEENGNEDGDENNENRRVDDLNESSDEMKENEDDNAAVGSHNNDDDNEDDDDDDDDDDEEEPNVGSHGQEQMRHNENRNLYYERDHEQIGAAGTLASIAESLNAMHGRLLINNHNMS